MKKIFLLLALCAAAYGGFIVLTSFVPKSDQRVVSAFSSGLAMCAPSIHPSIPNAKRFDPNVYASPAVMVRKNINSFTPAQITALKTGITAMKALPSTNKTSWQYQAAIHGTLLAGTQPSWNSCEHGTQFFLSWHRMYLYFFERILRSKSGDPTLTLPYWDYQTDPSLNSAYRNSSATNPLYDGTRAASINAGGTLPAAISTGINSSLGNVPYYDFQTDLEGPHGDVHVAVGGSTGNMRNVSKAALDPCFWLHHTNIDRLWQVWNDRCGGRTNPTNATWLNQTYTFFDETGAAVNMTGNQVVKTAASLDYRYDLPATLSCDFNFKDWKYIRYYIYRWPRPWDLTKNIVAFNFKEAQPAEDQKILTNLSLKLTGAEANDRILLELNDLKFEKAPEGIVEVYVNLPKGATATPKSKSFAGTVNLFAVGHKSKTGASIPVRVNITNALKTLNLNAKDLANIQLTLLVRGNTLQGKEIKTKTDVSASSFALIFERPQAQ